MLYMKQRVLCCLGNVFQHVKLVLEVRSNLAFKRKITLRDVIRDEI